MSSLDHGSRLNPNAPSYQSSNFNRPVYSGWIQSAPVKPKQKKTESSSSNNKEPMKRNQITSGHYVKPSAAARRLSVHIPGVEDDSDNEDGQCSDPGLEDDNQELDQIEQEKIDLLRFQIEFYFSDSNLAMDNHMLSLMNQDPHHFIRIEDIAEMTKIKSITNDLTLISDTIEQIDWLEMTPYKTRVKRKNYVPSKPKSVRNLRKTLFLYGLPPNVTEREVRILCQQCDRKVIDIRFDCNVEVIPSVIEDNNNNNNDDDTTEQGRSSPLMTTDPSKLDRPEKEVASVIMAKKFAPNILQNEILMIGGGNTTEQDEWLLETTTAADQEQSKQKNRYHYSKSHPIPNPNGNKFDFSHLRSCFVVFETQKQATQFVQWLGRLSSERDPRVAGVRAMHRYQFNIQRKKIYQAKTQQTNSNGLLFSPLFSNSHTAAYDHFLSPKAQSSRDNKTAAVRSSTTTSTKSSGSNGKRRFRDMFGDSAETKYSYSSQTSRNNKNDDGRHVRFQDVRTQSGAKSTRFARDGIVQSNDFNFNHDIQQQVSQNITLKRPRNFAQTTRHGWTNAGDSGDWRRQKMKSKGLRRPQTMKAGGVSVNKVETEDQNGVPIWVHQQWHLRKLQHLLAQQSSVNEPDIQLSIPTEVKKATQNKLD